LRVIRIPRYTAWPWPSGRAAVVVVFRSVSNAREALSSLSPRAWSEQYRDARKTSIPYIAEKTKECSTIFSGPLEMNSLCGKIFLQQILAFYFSIG
jgi:hypothetical protein